MSETLVGSSTSVSIVFSAHSFSFSSSLSCCLPASIEEHCSGDGVGMLLGGRMPKTSSYGFFEVALCIGSLSKKSAPGVQADLFLLKDVCQVFLNGSVVSFN